MMVELVGAFPKNVYSKGKRSSSYFSKSGQLKNINQLKYWCLEEVLRDKYKLSAEDSRELSSFLLPMLQSDRSKRASAQEVLGHPWLSQNESARPVSRMNCLSDYEDDSGGSLDGEDEDAISD